MANPKNKKRRRIIVFSAIGLALTGLTLAAVFRKREPVITVQADKVAHRNTTVKARTAKLPLFNPPRKYQHLPPTRAGACFESSEQANGKLVSFGSRVRQMSQWSCPLQPSVFWARY